MDPKTAAEIYITEKLGVKCIEDKFELLNKIVRAFFEKVPLQNISTSILPPEERFPSEQTVVENGTSLKGGMSVHNNWFFKMLLEALGYQVEFLPASLEFPPSVKPRKFGSHFGILVKDISKPGNLHLVDVGSGHPIFQAVPLNESPYEMTYVNKTYRFIEENNHWHFEFVDSENDNWTRLISYEKKPTNKNPSEVFKGPVLDLLREDWLIGGITAIHYPQPRSSSIPDIPDFNKDFDYVIRYNHDKIIFSNSSGFTWQEWVPQDQILATLLQYFPSIPRNDIEKKIEILSRNAEEVRF